MSANRVKALIKKIRGNGLTAERLRNLEVLVALSLLLDPKSWEGMSANEKQALRNEVTPLLTEIDAIIWQVIHQFNEEATEEEEQTFNEVRCNILRLRQELKLPLPA